MNNAVISGNIVNDVKLSNGSYGCYCNFTLSSLNGDKKIFVPVIAYGEVAEQLHRVKIGSKVALSGNLDTYKTNDEFKLGFKVKEYEVLTGEIVSSSNFKEYW